MEIKLSIPVLRVFDEAKAREFYLDFLGFKLDWEHRYGGNFPLYMQVSRDNCFIHLSEHHGDGCAGLTLRLEITGLDEFTRTLRAKDYKFFKPGNAAQTPWGTREMCVPDPFGNKLIFYERQSVS